MYKRVRVRVYACARVYMRVYVRACTCVRVCACVRVISARRAFPSPVHLVHQAHGVVPIAQPAQSFGTGHRFVVSLRGRKANGSEGLDHPRQSDRSQQSVKHPFRSADLT